ncbi:23S rRNA (guanine-N-2-)-methyltransferase rlmL [Pseudoalteromonas luteoviolacea B = ATCC 29581]|nr:23S rRNA (guanine-N-2-)-methyltransferase rlmL [Pseudoalteromonas luteoviolacea B = ATCC 29581]
MQFIALTSIGVETLLVEELQGLGATITKQTIGSVRFEADSLLAQQICLQTRFATRIMLMLCEGSDIKDKDALYSLAKKIAWSEWFGVQQSFAIEFSGTNAELKNSAFSGMVVKDAVVDYFSHLQGERPNVDKTRPNVRIVGKLNKTQCALYIDYSGPRLSDRGYRTKQGQAPIREHLAAALVKRSGWLNDVTQPLFDPCCGSGTLLIEAAMMAQNIAPGLNKRFAFQDLPGFRDAKFKAMKQALRDAQVTPNLWLIGHDVDESVLAVAKQNTERAGFAELINYRHSDANGLRSPAKRAGVVLSNLPYGERLGGMAELVNLYRNLGASLKQHFHDWQVGLLGTDESLFNLLKLVRTKTYKFKNGPLDVLLNLYQLDARQVSRSARTNELHFENSSAFANRMKKNLQGLKSWLKQNDVEAYRAYDADIPEYNVAVDVYPNHAVIYEYAAPKNVDEQIAEKRLQDVITLTAQTLNVDAENIAVKVRKKQKGENQYEVLSRQDRILEVNEFGAKFKVNLFDYLDTGLFLDHRLARRFIAQNSKDKRFLNLFSYTGSASVHAALGGAKSVMTVDMSKTYLKWAEENFELNGLRSPRYRFEQADCLKWLEQAQGQYDLIFLDPPTFSNSKRMDAVFDVQRDHIQLFTWVKKILSSNGTLLFSNNKRGFEMDELGLLSLGLKATCISDNTISPDFKRNKQIHNSWLITHA